MESHSDTIIYIPDVIFEHITFLAGVKYYTTVTACTSAEKCTSATSDGIIIDTTAPRVGLVQDGTKDEDIQFQAAE